MESFCVKRSRGCAGNVSYLACSLIGCCSLGYLFLVTLIKLLSINANCFNNVHIIWVGAGAYKITWTKKNMKHYCLISIVLPGSFTDMTVRKNRIIICRFWAIQSGYKLYFGRDGSSEHINFWCGRWGSSSCS